nr:cupin domain-containing protein [Actinomycetota bacterium]
MSVSYMGSSGEASAVFRSTGDVDSLQIGSATMARFVASGSSTDGRFGLFRWDMTGGAGGASTHFHRTFSESFYVLDGTVRLYDGRDWVDAGPGDFLHVPEGGVHGFHNEGDAAASMLILFAPAPPRERYFQELAEIISSGREMTDEEWTDFFARHDQYMVQT